MSRSASKGNFVHRLVTNVGRTPGRTLRSLTQRFSPDYRLERTAERDVLRWMPRDRQRELESVPGQSSVHECRLLAYLATQAPAGGDVVEIGALKGRSTAWLVEGANRCNPAPRVVSIDPHQRGSWEGFNETVERFQLDRRGLTVFRNFSHEVGQNWSEPISLLWVDGCHEYDAVVQDIEDFVPHIVPSGWVVFDDAAGGHFPGSERAIAERMVGRAGFTRVGTIRHLQVFRRSGDAASGSQQAA